MSLKDTDGNYLANHSQLRGIFGLAIASTSIINLAAKVLNELDFKYFLSYKCCQDNLELYFNKIRRCGGWNPNPTTVQFKAALKKLILRNEVQSSTTGNCIPPEKRELFTLGLNFTSKRKLPIITEDNENPEPLHKIRPVYEVDDSEDEVEDTSQLFDPKENSFKENSEAHIAGWVAKRVQKKLKCDTCSPLVQNSINDPAPVEILRLIRRKSQSGALKEPSNSVIKLIQETERELRKLFVRKWLPSSLEIKQIPITVMRRTNSERLFPSMPHHHIFKTFSRNKSSHHSLLTRYVIQYYMQVRLGNYAKDFNTRVALKGQPSRRHQLNKLMCFMHI